MGMAGPAPSWRSSCRGRDDPDLHSGSPVVYNAPTAHVRTEVLAEVGAVEK